ncbi:hypothetical protein P7C71_g5013, partial [Lecanoromycetidae sp. Uapishka_2]
MKFSNFAPLLVLLITPPISGNPLGGAHPAAISKDSDLFNRLKAKGTDYWKALEARRQDKCPVDVPKDQAKFDKYWVERFAVNAPPALVPQFVPRKVNNGQPLPQNAFLGVEYRSKTNGVADKTAYDNLHAPQLSGPSMGSGGVIIAANNDAREDKSPASDKLRYSEIVFWEYSMTANTPAQSAKVSNLNWVFRSNIINTDTTNLILEIHKRRAHKDVEQQWTMDDDPDAFIALIGCDNVKSIVWMLNDHVNAFIRKGIPSIWTQPDGKSLAIEIGIKPRNS